MPGIERGTSRTSQAGPLCRGGPTRESRGSKREEWKRPNLLSGSVRGTPASPATSLDSSTHGTRPSLPLPLSHEPIGLSLPLQLPFPSVPAAFPHRLSPASPSPERSPERHCHQALTPHCLPNFCRTFSLHKQADLLTRGHRARPRSSPLASLPKSLQRTAGSSPPGVPRFSSASHWLLCSSVTLLCCLALWA